MRGWVHDVSKAPSNRCGFFLVADWEWKGGSPTHCCTLPVPELQAILYIWVNYHDSLTWILRPFRDDFPKIQHDSRLRSRREVVIICPTLLGPRVHSPTNSETMSRRYNLPRYSTMLEDLTPKITPGPTQKYTRIESHLIPFNPISNSI